MQRGFIRFDKLGVPNAGMRRGREAQRFEDALRIRYDSLATLRKRAASWRKYAEQKFPRALASREEALRNAEEIEAEIARREKKQGDSRKDA